jgi:YidC/Oxa1 family membrane protein insertase
MNVFYQSILKVLYFFCQIGRGDFGLAIIALTFLIRLLLLPINLKFQKSQKEALNFQKEIAQIKEKYKDEKEQLKALIFLYQKRKFNPFSSLFWILIQLPILYILYRVFIQGFRELQVQPFFLGFFDLSKPNFFLASFAGILQYFQFPSQKISSKDPAIRFSNMIQKQMNFFLSLFTFLLLLRFPSALSLYLISNSIFSFFQNLFFKRYV